MNGISIVICCYNSAKRLPATIEHLAKLELSGILCEVIIVDNRSTDDTAHTAKSEWEKYKPSDIDFKVVNEMEPGLSHARKKGFDEAKFDCILYCDDDNSLDAQYIQVTEKLFKKYPTAGVLGGKGTPNFGTLQKPDWFDKYQGIYAVGEQAAAEGIVTQTRGFVFGAGSVWKREVLEKVLAQPMITTGRIGNSLSSSDDMELCFKAILLGYDIVYSPDLRFIHYLPEPRISESYVKRFQEDSLPNSYRLHGLVYKTGIQKDMFNTRLKRSWIGQVLVVVKKCCKKADVIKTNVTYVKITFCT